MVVRICRTLLFATVLTLTISACASKSKTAGKKMSVLESEMENLRSYQAEQTTQIAALQRDIRQLSGRLEEFEFHQRTKGSGEMAGLKHDINKLQRRVPPPAIVPEIELNDDMVLAKSLPPAAGGLFDTALLKLRDGAFNEAYPMLEELKDLSYGANWAPNVLFWLGVCSEGMTQNRRAISFYHQLVTQYPKHERAALAMLRQASVFIREGDMPTAKVTFEKVIQDYPKSNAAARARERLKDL